MGPIKAEILLLATVLAGAALVLLDLIGVKWPRHSREPGTQPVGRRKSAYKIGTAAVVVALCVYGLYSEATTGKSLSAIAACKIFSSGASCNDRPTGGAADSEPDRRQAASLREPTAPPSKAVSTFCNQVNQPTGNPELDGMYMAAWELDHGVNGRVDRVRARQLYRDAAERGHRASQYNLAVMLHRGQGGPVDNASAVHWHQQAANQDDYLAVISLGAAYTDPWPDVSRNYARGLEYWLIAERCERGNITNNVGVIHALGGYGVERDLARAAVWFRRAEARGSRHAAQNLATIRDGFDPSQEELWWDEIGTP